MKVIVLSFVIYHLSSIPAGAQTFTQRLQKPVAGQGTVTIHQSDSIDRLVNQAPLAGKATAAATPTAPTAATPTASPTPGATTTETVDTTTVKKTQSYKVTGYRVQAFAGGNSRADRQKAEGTRNAIKQQFPNVPVYVHFYSPRWICRVGNYRTYEEAHQMLVTLQNMGFSQCSIVKGKIIVNY